MMTSFSSKMNSRFQRHFSHIVFLYHYNTRIICVCEHASVYTGGCVSFNSSLKVGNCDYENLNYVYFFGDLDSK